MGRSGVYIITNKVNGKIYVGSSLNVTIRLRAHKNALLRNDHENKHLQKSWNKYGQDKFEFTKVCSVPRENLAAVEKTYIEKHNSCDFKYGYNIISEPYLKPEVTVDTRKKLRDRFSGEGSSNVILTWEDVKKIRSMYAEDEENTWKKLSKVFGVSVTCIQNILQNKTWKDDTYKYIPHRYRTKSQRKLYSGENASGAKLSWERVKKIRDDFNAGVRACTIARKYCVTYSTVQDIIKNRTWKIY